MKLSRGFVAFLAGLGLTAASALPLSFAGLLLVPGVFVAVAVGAGTVHEPGRWGGGWTLAVIYVSSFVIWGVLAYVVTSFFAKRRVV
jgi:hypothetical protein